MELKHTADREGRLSSFLLGELKMSTGLMNKLKWGDSIQVNGVPQHTNYPVKMGDVITFLNILPRMDRCTSSMRMSTCWLWTSLREC